MQNIGSGERAFFFFFKVYLLQSFRGQATLRKAAPHPGPRGALPPPGASFRTWSSTESDLKVGACPGAGRGDPAPGRSEPAGPELPASTPQVLARPRVSERPGSVDRAVGGAGAKEGLPRPPRLLATRTPIPVPLRLRWRPEVRAPPDQRLWPASNLNSPYGSRPPLPTPCPDSGRHRHVNTGAHSGVPGGY